MENLYIENKNNENKEVKIEKQSKIAFSGKVLPSTSAEFEALFEGMTRDDGAKLQFEDKLLKLIDVAREKFADDKLQLEEKVKKSLEFDLEEEKNRIEDIINELNDLVSAFEGKAKKQLARFKNTISNDSIVKAQKENQNTIGLLEEFSCEYAIMNMKNQKLDSQLTAKEEEVNALNEQLKNTMLELNSTRESLEQAKTENIKIKAELEVVKEELSSIQEKFNIQLQKNDTLRDVKEQLESTLADIEVKHDEEKSSLRDEIARLKALNTDLENEKLKLKSNLDISNNKVEDFSSQISQMTAKALEKDAQINELKTDVKVSQKEVEMLKVNLNEVKESKNKLESENKELNNNLKELEVDYNRLIDNNKETHKRMTRIIDENKTLKETVNQLNSEKEGK